MKTRAPIFTIALIVLALGAPSVWSQNGLAGAVSRIRNARGLLDQHCGQSFVAADFDNDHKPDGAVLLHVGNFRGRLDFRIELHDSAHKARALTFASNESSLSIRALDVNRDGATDIVVEQAFTHKRLQVWLNDGRGAFYPARVDEFQSEDDGSLPQCDAPPDDQHGPALHTHVKRGTKLILQRGLSSCPRLPYPGRYVRTLPSLIQDEASGPHPSRAPPISTFST
jgi:hypothetical protein